MQEVSCFGAIVKFIMPKAILIGVIVTALVIFL